MTGPLVSRQQLLDDYCDLVADAYEEITADDARDAWDFSVSGLGRCLRRGAYALSRTPPSNPRTPEQKRQANHGKAIHAMVLPRLAALAGPDATFEQPVTLRAAGLEIGGHYDLYDPARAVLVDVKTVDDYAMSRTQARGPSSEHLIQAAGYATALVQAGHRVDWLLWVYIHRGSGAELREARAFDPVDDALAVIGRAGDVAAMVPRPDDAPREGPGPSWAIRRKFSVCDACPWLTRCWDGTVMPTAVPDAPPQSAVLADTDAADAVAHYARLRDEESTAKDGKDFWNAVLQGVPPGDYGAWSYKRNSRGAIQVKPVSQARPSGDRVGADWLPG